MIYKFNSSFLIKSFLVYLTFNLFNLNFINCKDESDRICVASGLCGEDDSPCNQTTKPFKLKEEKDLKLLKELCPSFSGGPVCCEGEQLEKMKIRIAPLLAFNRCAPCLNNFLDLFCYSACSPDQDKFIKVLNSSESEVFKNKSKVDVMSYSINLADADKLFDSCSLAYSASLESNFLTFFGDPTTGKDFLYATGSLSSFFIDFYFLDGNRTFHLIDKNKEEEVKRIKKPVEIQFKNCNETSRGNFCLCSQCSTVDCPYVPGIDEYQPCVLFGLWSCWSYFILISYIFFLSLIIIFSVHYMRQKRTRDREISSEEKSEVDEQVENIGLKMERMFSNFFERWTRICVRNPWIVIFIGLLTVTLLSLGLLNFTVISDPVELWSSPNSLARQQREYYNTKFSPFYRVQQIIIKNTNLNKSNIIVSNTTFSNLFDYDFMKNALELQKKITSLEAKFNDNETVRLSDLCYQPTNNGYCVIQSPFTWFQENEANFVKNKYLKRIKSCFSDFFSSSDCFGQYGGPAFPYVALGGFDLEKKDYNSSTSLIITILLNNHISEKENEKAIAWEKEFLNLMEKYIKELPKNSFAKISYYSERSVSDELDRQSLSDVGTIAISYVIMFIYVSMALGQLISSHKFLIDSKIGLAIVGVLIVLVSVSSSVGFLSLCNVKATLIIIEVIPFLVLAVGIDNIFIIVQTLNRENLYDDSIENKMVKVMSKVGPSLLLAFLSEVACFFLGAMSSMPCIRIFALNAALALVFDFLLQMSVFLAFLSLDVKRQKEARYDILVCIKSKKSNLIDKLQENNSMLYNFFNNIYAPFLMKDIVRFFIIMIFLLSFCVSALVVKDIDVGLDQELSMPKDSYVHHYFLDQKTELRVGAPMFFVVKNPIDVSSKEARGLIAGYSDLSLVNLVKAKSQQNNSFLATGVNSWIEAYDSWANDVECFKVFKSNNSFCGTTVKDRENNCFKNESLIDPFLSTLKPEFYYLYLNDFLNDVPSRQCAFGGRAQYKNAVKLNLDANKRVNSIEASYFMAYHSVLRSSKDFVDAFNDATITSKFIQNKINENNVIKNKIEVFPYSVFYVFYDQFLTMWKDTFLSLVLSLLAIFIVTFVLTGFDLRNTLIAFLTLISILFNILNVMYWWNISLNAVSLVNLVMSIGISVEFCSHILHHYCTNSSSSSKLRAQNALAKMGSSVFSGIALTKFVGIVVLANSKSQIFQVFYFRMYLAIILVGSTHGLILLPVLLSLLGGKPKLQSH